MSRAPPSAACRIASRTAWPFTAGSIVTSVWTAAIRIRSATLTLPAVVSVVGPALGELRGRLAGAV
jgi:hypothetical protein